MAVSDEELLVPDFWLNETCDVLWLQVRRKVFSQAEAREGMALLRAQVKPPQTAYLKLHDVALEISLAVDHPPYDTLYIAFAIAMGAEGLVTADRKFAESARKHPDPALARLPVLLVEWSGARDR